MLFFLQGCLPIAENFGNSGWKVNVRATFGQIPTENGRVRFEVVLSFELVRTKRNVAYHLPISRFLLGSRLTLHKFAPFWIQTVTDVAILR